MFPKIIHPVKILLFRRLETRQDDVLGVTGKIEWSEPVELLGQVAYNDFERLTAVPDGNDPVNDEHIVFSSNSWNKSGGVVADELQLEDSSRLIITEIKPQRIIAEFFGMFMFISRGGVRDERAGWRLGQNWQHS